MKNRVAYLFLPLILFASLLTSCGGGSSSTGATATIAPVDRHLAERQFVATFNRWTVYRTATVGCIAGVCNQEVMMTLSYITSELLEDLLNLEIAQRQEEGEQITQQQYDNLLAEKQQRLATTDQIPFLLIINPLKPTIPLRNDQMDIGPVDHTFALTTSSGEEVEVIRADQVLDENIPRQPDEITRGYIFFQKTRDEGETFIQETDTSFLVRLELDDELSPKQPEVTWNFDLVDSHRPPPIPPTPTTDPNTTPEPLMSKEDAEIIIEGLEVLAPEVISFEILSPF